jgi:hypothetical protein
MPQLEPDGGSGAELLQARGRDQLRRAALSLFGAISIAGTRYQFSINIGRFAFIRGASPQDVSLFGCEEACKELFQIVGDGT